MRLQYGAVPPAVVNRPVRDGAKPVIKTAAMSELNQRARRILAAVVQEYLATGEAVGSRTITRRHGVDISAATVRNVMSDLEEAGLLAQPHTSAGRVPTPQGLRFFVDSLLKMRGLTAREREELRSRYSFSTSEQFDSALREAGKVLSDLSQHTVVVSTPKIDADVLEHLEFMRLPSGALLAVLLTKSGQVQNKLIQVDFSVGQEELERIHNFLHAQLGGLTLTEVRARIATELSRERAQYDLLEQKALELSREALRGTKEDGAHVIIEGHAHLLEQAARATASGQGSVDVEKMKALFRALEEKQQIVHLLEKTEQAEGLQVFIGAETEIGGLADFSVVASSYGPEDRPLGTLGVIGPNWMNYPKVISLVEFTAELVSDVIARR
jgi:heat-inducible transcriptional repressor